MANIVYASPQPQVVGGFQPQSPVVMGTMQPQIPVMMSTSQPQTPVVMGTMQPQSPGVVISPQSPVMISNVQPQATSPMQVHSKVYGANNMIAVGRREKRDWSYGLFGCFGRCGLCVNAWCCPCIVFSKTRQRLRSLQYEGRVLPGGGDTCTNHCCLYAITAVIGHPWLMGVQPRVEMRERYGIRGNLLKDWLAAFCCTPCALTQERREVEMEEASFQPAQQVLRVDEK